MPRWMSRAWTCACSTPRWKSLLRLREKTGLRWRGDNIISSEVARPTLVAAARLGTDWPVFSGYSIRSRLMDAATTMSLDERQTQLIANGNARRLLSLPGA